MTDPRQFRTGKAASQEPSGPLDCSAVELWLAEWSEQSLPTGIAELIDAHACGCSACGEKLAQARRGREWLLVLKQEALEPPADLVAKILVRTSIARAAAGATTEHGAPDPSALIEAPDNRRYSDVVASSISARKKRGGKQTSGKKTEYLPGEKSDLPAIPAWQHSSVVLLRRTIIEPRLAMVAAMAFFSIALTLNLLGVRLTGFHASDLKPRDMHRAMTRQYAEANARVVRYYENLRIVYEVEARVQQLRRAAETSTPAEQPAKPRKQSSDSTGNPSNSARGSRRGPFVDDPLVRENKHSGPSVFPDPRPIAAGPRMDAALHPPASPELAKWVAGHTLATSFAASLAFQPAPSASSCSFPTVCFSMPHFSKRERRLA